MTPIRCAHTMDGMVCIRVGSERHDVHVDPEHGCWVYVHTDLMGKGYMLLGQERTTNFITVSDETP